MRMRCAPGSPTAGWSCTSRCCPRARAIPRAWPRTVAERTGLPGDYAVVVGRSLRVGPSSEARDAADEAFDAHQQEGLAAVLLDSVDRLEEKSSGGEASRSGR